MPPATEENNAIGLGQRGATGAEHIAKIIQQQKWAEDDMPYYLLNNTMVVVAADSHGKLNRDVCPQTKVANG